jgi:hypothetical protein
MAGGRQFNFLVRNRGWRKLRGTVPGMFDCDLFRSPSECFKGGITDVCFFLEMFFTVEPRNIHRG